MLRSTFQKKDFDVNNIYKILESTTPSILKPAAKRTWNMGRVFIHALAKCAVKIHPYPIIILGNQKSGTSAIAALIAQYGRLSITNDLQTEIYNPTYHYVKSNKLDIGDFIKNHKVYFSKDIIKEPNLTLIYHELAKYFPEARYVFVVRDPRENIRSILNRLGLPGNQTELSRQQWRNLPASWKLIIDNRWLECDAENYIEMLAWRWNHMANIYLQNNENFILSYYETFLENKMLELERLAKKLKIYKSKDIRNKLNLQYQPKGNHSLSWEEFFGQNNLKLINSKCVYGMRELRYNELSSK